jgi:hypothetical protein
VPKSDPRGRSWLLSYQLLTLAKAFAKAQSNYGEKELIVVPQIAGNIKVGGEDPVLLVSLIDGIRFAHSAFFSENFRLKGSGGDKG